MASKGLKLTESHGSSRLLGCPVGTLMALMLTVAGLSPMASAATGAGADDGAAESSVRLPVSTQAPDPSNSTSTVKLPLSTVQKSKRNSFDELSVSFGDESYVSKTSGATSYEEISARVRNKVQGRYFSAVIDAGASVAANVNNYSNVEVPEAYFKVGTPALAQPDATGVSRSNLFGISLSAGRKKERWSGLDSDWSLGLVQPFNKFDALRPTEQGFTGAFTEANVGPVSLLLFASPIFIPEQGAPYQLNNGKFITTSPWFSKPPDQLIIMAQTRNALYNINMPETSSVVNHASYGVRARIADQSGEGFYVQGSFLRKPMNAINLSFTGQLSIVENDTYGDITIFPEVVYHTITAADIGYDSKTVSVGVSMLHEKPDQPNLYDGLTTSQYSDMTMISPAIEVRTFRSHMWGPRFRLASLNTQGGDVTPVGEYAQNGNMFGPRTMFRHALSGSVESTLHRADHWSLDASARWIEELDELGSILMTDLRLELGDSWRVALQADVLGSRQGTADTTTFIARYRANDRAGIRLTYLF